MKPTCQHLDLELPASRTVRNKYLLFKPPSLWYSIIAAQDTMCFISQRKDITSRLGSLARV